MKIHIALYDPSHLTRERTYWTWRSPKLDIKLLNQLYYEVAASTRPEDPNQLSPKTMLGGFASIGGDFVFVYRFADGGYDSFGRPGRFVMIVAGLSLNPAGSSDLGQIVSGPTFAKLVADAKLSCPVSQPPDLSIDLDLSPSKVDPILVSTALRNKRLVMAESGGPAAAEILSVVSHVYSNLLANGSWQCKFHIEVETGKAVAEYEESPRHALPERSDQGAQPRHQFENETMESKIITTGHFPGKSRRNAFAVIILCLIIGFTVAEVFWRSIIFFWHSDRSGYPN